MNIVTISQDHRLTIPPGVRRRLGLRSGQRLQVLELDGYLCLVPERKASELRGFLRGIAAGTKRDGDRV